MDQPTDLARLQSVLEWVRARDAIDWLLLALIVPLLVPGLRLWMREALSSFFAAVIRATPEYRALEAKVEEAESRAERLEVAMVELVVKLDAFGAIARKNGWELPEPTNVAERIAALINRAA